MTEEKTNLVVEAKAPRTPLFTPGTWMAKIDFINHLVLFNNVLMTVLAEKVGGKTSFATVLQNHLDPKIKSIYMKLPAAASESTITKQLVTQLQLDKAADYDLAAIVQTINDGQEHLLVIVDDAHYVSAGFIQDVVELISKQKAHSYFHLCLIADYSILQATHAVTNPAYVDLIHTIELGAFNENETRTYMLQRALAANLIEQPLTDDQYKQFYELTRGNLARINASLEAFIKQSKAPNKDKKYNIVKTASLALSTFLAIGCAYLTYDLLHGLLSASKQVTVTEHKIIPLPKPEEIKIVKKEVPEVLLSYIPFWEVSAKHQLVEVSFPKQVKLFDEYDDEEEHLNSNTVALVDKVVVIPKLKLAAKPAAPKPQLKPKVKPAHKTLAPSLKVRATHTGNYTIQLIASHRKQDLLRFRQKNALVAKTKIRHFSNDKGSWYVLTMGEFSNRGQAQIQANKLPPLLTKLHPWIRTTAGLAQIG